MIGPARLMRRLLSLLRAGHRDAELDEELRFHIEMEASRLREEGHSAGDALAIAWQRFGDATRVREATRDSRGVRYVEDLWHDLRFAARSLARHRVFTTVAVLTLAIGIGATTAIFGAVYGVMLAPLPYADSDRIMTLWQSSTTTVGTRDEVAVANFLDWQQRQRTFTAIAAAEPYSLDYVGPEGPERFQNAVVTESFFDILGVAPLLGRTFTPEEFTAGRNGVAVLSERLWRTRFAADSTIVGRTIVLDSTPIVVVGIMPSSVELPHGEQLWTPKVFRPDERTSRQAAYYSVLGRLAPGMTIAAANADMQRVARELATEYPATNATSSIDVVPLAEVMFGETRQSLWLLLGAVAFVLLIACANVASLQLAQALRRQRELAIRAALGAGSGRLGRQLLTESLLLSVIGGAAGVIVAVWGIRSIRLLAPVNLPRVEELSINGTVLLFAAGMSIVAAMIFGAFPVLHARRTRILEVIVSAGGGGATHAGARRRLQRLLVGGEVALALTLLVGAGLLVRSFTSLLSVDRGFDPHGVVNVTLQAWGYYPTGAHRIAFVDEATRRLGGLPGVQIAGVTSALPLSVPIGAERTGMIIEGQSAVSDQERPVVRVAAITRDYPAAVRMPLRSGRGFETTDNAGSAPVALVNEALAQRFWPGESAVGKRVTFRFQSAPLERTVVGVVGNVRHDGLQNSAAPAVFVPHAQAPTGALQIVVRTSGDMAAAQRAIRAELAAMNGVMPLSEITSLDVRLSDSLRERRFHLGLLGAFSLTALVLAAIGIYGVMNQLTSERTREIGVRVALGARAADVVMMVLRQGMSIALLGLAAGVAVAMAATRLMTSMLFDVQPLDPMTYLLSITVIIIVASTASFVPAWRAARVNPTTVLRSD